MQSDNWSWPVAPKEEGNECGYCHKDTGDIPVKALYMKSETLIVCWECAARETPRCHGCGFQSQISTLLWDHECWVCFECFHTVTNDSEMEESYEGPKVELMDEEEDEDSFGQTVPQRHGYASRGGYISQEDRFIQDFMQNPWTEEGKKNQEEYRKKNNIW